MSIKIQASTRETDGPLLELEDVRTYFQTPRGVVRAVDGVSLKLERGKALGIVGESGSGKTILSRSIMGLLPPQGHDSPGQRSLRGSGDRWPVTRGDARHLGQGDGDDLPGSDDVAEPLDEDRRTDRRAAANPPRHVEEGVVGTAERLMQDVRIPAPGRRLAAVSARDVGRHASAHHDRHRDGVRPDVAARRRADHCARRHRAGADPRPARRAAPGAQHVAAAGHPRPRRRRRPHRRHRRDVRRQAGRDGTDGGAVRQHEDAVHRGPAAEHPEDRRSQPHPAERHQRAPARLGQPAARAAASRRAARTRRIAAARRSRR